MKSKKNIDKTFDLLLKKLIFSDYSNAKIIINDKNINIEEFSQYFLKNSQKSSKFGQILPSVVFLIISLISFSLVILNSKLAKFWVLLENNNIKIAIILNGTLFLILALVLLIQKYILKTKVLYIYTGYNSGYRNISKKKYNEIVNFLNDVKDKKETK